MLKQEFQMILTQRILVRMSGNALSEYGLVGICIIVVALVGMTGLSSSLNIRFFDLRQDMQSQIQVTSLARVKAAQAKAAYEAAQAAKSSLIHNSQVFCVSGSPCLSVQAYNPAQTAGANGIDLVDHYADIIKRLAEAAHIAPNSDLTFALMLDDLAADGHNVAGDERAVLTMYAKYGSSFDFSIRERYAATLNRAIDYLNQHPQLLSPQDTQTLRIASSNITQQISDFLGNSNPKAVTNTSINPKFTDAGGSNGATYVDHQATTICGTGGIHCR